MRYDANTESQPSAYAGIWDPRREQREGIASLVRVQVRLTAARYYWIGTTRPDGRPHSMPIWAIWTDDVLMFSTGRESRKNKNLQAESAIV